MFGTENQKADIDSESVVFGLVDLVIEPEGDNRTVVGLDSEVVLVRGVPQAVAVAVAVVQPDAAAQELTAGYVHQMCCQSFWSQLQLQKLSPHGFGSGLKKMTLFVQAEAWPTLSGSQQVLVCLLGSVQICGPAVGNNKIISSANGINYLKMHIVHCKKKGLNMLVRIS